MALLFAGAPPSVADTTEQSASSCACRHPKAAPYRLALCTRDRALPHRGGRPRSRTSTSRRGSCRPPTGCRTDCTPTKQNAIAASPARPPGRSSGSSRQQGGLPATHAAPFLHW
eukprot:GHVT01083598.1.p2 GENE.GHVT01083598.1~~GHVT01083598.1.p2  ORF type:complete len:114 (+),score=22.71 GHVT01083598.1:355-696(+)